MHVSYHHQTYILEPYPVLPSSFFFFKVLPPRFFEVHTVKCTHLSVLLLAFKDKNHVRHISCLEALIGRLENYPHWLLRAAGQTILPSMPAHLSWQPYKIGVVSILQMRKPSLRYQQGEVEEGALKPGLLIVKALIGLFSYAVSICAQMYHTRNAGMETTPNNTKGIRENHLYPSLVL